MTGHDDFDRTLARWFEAEATLPAPAGGLERVLEATRRRRPRAAWLAGPGSHWVGYAATHGSSAGLGSLRALAPGWSLALIVLLIIAAVVGGAVLVGARLVLPSPPAGHLGRLAYGLDGDIYLADWDGGSPVRIADGRPMPRVGPAPGVCGFFWAGGPMWSPDGRHIAYRSDWDNGCRPTVHISDADGHEVASFPGTGSDISWSPDSTRVATWVDAYQTIGVYGTDGVRQALLTVPPGCALPGEFDPMWSPDGRSVVVAPCVVPIDGSTPVEVPGADPRSHFDAASSRDRTRLTYIDYPSSVTLVVAGADGTELRVLTGARTPDSGGGPGAAYQDPVMSPAGDRVAFTWSPALYDLTPDPPVEHAYELRVLDVASGTVTTLDSAIGVRPFDPLGFSPEGDRILFARTDADDVPSLWSIRADGSDGQLLVPGSDRGDWQWQPGGS